MSSSTEPRSGLKYGWTLGESGWNTEMDSNLLAIGKFAFHLSVKDRDLSTPPGSPSSGDTYIVKATGTGAWASHDKAVAVWSASLASWVFGAPREGWVAWIEDEAKLVVYHSSAWSTGVAL